MTEHIGADSSLERGVISKDGFVMLNRTTINQKVHTDANEAALRFALEVDLKVLIQDQCVGWLKGYNLNHL